jgi:hypothetical protein
MGLPTFHAQHPVAKIPVNGGDGTCHVHTECIGNIKEDIVGNTARIGEVAKGQQKIEVKLARWGGALAVLVVLMPIVVAIVKELIR